MCSAISHDPLWIDLKKRVPFPAHVLLLYSHPDYIMPEAYVTQTFEVMQCDIDDAPGQPKLHTWILFQSQ